MSDDFCLVKRKKWIARKTINRPRRISAKSYADNEATQVDVNKFLTRLISLREQMETSEYFIQAMSTLEDGLRAGLDTEKLAKIVCFGIGPFTRNFQALHQLAFILSLQKQLDITEALYFDPVFRDSEKKVLEELQCSLMLHNCEGKYLADAPTLFYLPHCPNSLTNNLLWKNWQPGTLRNVVLINNSLESLVTNKPERLLRMDSGYILDVLQYTKEFPLEDYYETHNVFNDLSLHIFAEKKMPPPSDSFWTPKEAPIYEDGEMIANDLEKLDIN